MQKTSQCTGVMCRCDVKNSTRWAKHHFEFKGERRTELGETLKTGFEMSQLVPGQHSSKAHGSWEPNCEVLDRIY